MKIYDEQFNKYVSLAAETVPYAKNFGEKRRALVRWILYAFVGPALQDSPRNIGLENDSPELLRTLIKHAREATLRLEVMRAALADVARLPPVPEGGFDEWMRNNGCSI